MSLPVIILFVGLAYVVLFGGVGFFRREGFSLRFALESAGITALGALLAAFTQIPVNPVVFLILLYLLTMRVRILVDLGSMFARRGNFSPAGKLYSLAERAWPDATSALILKVNQATLLLQEGKLDESIAMFGDVLQQAGRGYLGVKYEAAAHYNLGVAHQRNHQMARATVEFNAVIDTWPASLYAQQAQRALDRQRTTLSRADENVPEDHHSPQP